MSNLNTFTQLCPLNFKYISKKKQNFVRIYLLTVELLIFKYRR